MINAKKARDRALSATKKIFEDNINYQTRRGYRDAVFRGVYSDDTQDVLWKWLRSLGYDFSCHTSGSISEITVRW